MLAVTMPVAHEIEPITSSIWIWRFYDPAVKTDLFSTAIATGAGIYLIDPIDLAPDALADLGGRGAVAGIVITNENHDRAADRFAAKLQVPIHAHPARLDPTTGLTAVSIDGGPGGEIAIHSDADGGTMIIGDALINVEPYGFAVLPAKYCSNAKVMRRSLPKLLDYSFERILFAHGTPIMTGARQRLEELLRRR